MILTADAVLVLLAIWLGFRTVKMIKGKFGKK
jgi:hypothetical protein